MSEESSVTTAEEARIRQKLNKRYQEWHGFAIHAVVFFMVNLILWIAWALLHFNPSAREAFTNLTDSASLVDALSSIILPLLVTLGWGVGLVAHYAHYYIEHGPGLDRHEAAVQREIERYRASKAYEKPKNEERSHLELTEDGEIEEVYDESPRSQSQKQH